MIRLAALFLFVLTSCSDKSIRSKINEVDNLVVIDDQSKFSHIETRKEVVEGFKDVLKGESEPTTCEPQGTVLFKKGKDTMLQVGYYKDASVCSFLIVSQGNKREGYRLSYNTLLYLGVYFQKLKKRQDARHN